MMAETKTRSEISTTTVTTSPTYAAPPKSGVSLNLQYFKTGPGIIKIVEIVIACICMACVAPAWTNGSHWFLFVVVTAFVSTVLWCFIYLLSLRQAINLPIDWLLTELILTALFTLLYLIACIVQISTTVVKPRPPTRLKGWYMFAGELLNTGITTLLYLIAIIVQFCSIELEPGRNIAGGIFAIFNLLAYAVGSFYLYRDWKDSHPNSSFSGSVLKRNP